MASESDLNRYRTDAARVRGEIAKTTSTVAVKRKKAADARGAAQRSTTASTIRLKLAEADRAEGEANAAEKKRADLEKKLAGLEGRIVKAQIDVDKKRATDQKKALDAIRRENARAASQFTPTTPFSVPKWRRIPGVSPRPAQWPRRARHMMSSCPTRARTRTRSPGR